jgi:hypothetical protein
VGIYQLQPNEILLVVILLIYLCYIDVQMVDFHSHLCISLVAKDVAVVTLTHMQPAPARPTFGFTSVNCMGCSDAWLTADERWLSLTIFAYSHLALLEKLELPAKASYNSRCTVDC